MNCDEELKPPEYCDIYQPFTVEELALSNYPHKLHYGKCSVIGRISRENGRHFLSNIRIENLPKEFSLPEGQVRVELFSKYYKSYIPVDHTCEVFGEALLRDVTQEIPNELPKTSKELIMELQDFRIKLQKESASGNQIESRFQEELETMKKRYVPIMQIHSVNVIGHASELLQCNLEIRVLRKLIQQKLGGGIGTNKTKGLI